jgi:hypothetical protein
MRIFADAQRIGVALRANVTERRRLFEKRYYI